MTVKELHDELKKLLEFYPDVATLDVSVDRMHLEAFLDQKPSPHFTVEKLTEKNPLINLLLVKYEGSLGDILKRDLRG